MARTITERIELHAAGYLELRGPSGRLRGWYNPARNELCFMDRKDHCPDRIDLTPYQARPEETIAPRSADS